MLIKNRKDAGNQLAKWLDQYKDTNALILACSCNSVEIAYHLSLNLNADFSLLMGGKLSYPGQNEFCFGAVCEGEQIYVDTSKYLLTDTLIQSIIERKKQSIEDNITLFRNGNALPELTDRTVILVDDALIHGLEFIPAIRLCKALKAKKIVIAVPVGGIVFDHHLNEANEIMIVHQYNGLSNIEQIYESVTPLKIDEIKKLLNQPLNVATK